MGDFDILEQIAGMVPKPLLRKFPKMIEGFIDSHLARIETADGEAPAALIINSAQGYVINLIRLDENLNMTVVDKIPLDSFFNR